MRILCVVYACFLSLSICAAEINEVTQDLPIMDVLVTPGEAVVTRSGRVKLPPGRSRVRIPDLPAALVPDSLQIDVSPEVLLESTDMLLVATRDILPEEMLAIEKDIDKAESKDKSLHDRQQVLGTELALLQEFSPGGLKFDELEIEEEVVEIGGVARKIPATLSLDSRTWLRIIDFIGRRAEQTRQKLAVIAAERAENTASLNALKAKMKELKDITVPARLVADLLVNTDKATEVPVTVRYTVNNVIWYPAYELRASESGRRVTVERQSLVAQNTGEDWNGVRMSFATLPPQRSVIVPQIPVWKIAYSGMSDSVERQDFGTLRPEEELFANPDALKGPQILSLRKHLASTRRSLGEAFDYRDQIAQESILMGIGNLAGVGGGGRFGFRSGGGKRNAIRFGGGSKRTESAVDRSLRYLSEVQRADGSWNDSNSSLHTTGLTSLSLLAFLGAGNSTRFGKYRKNVDAATRYLKTSVAGNGKIGNSLFDQAMGATALAESFGMGADKSCAEAAQRALIYLDQMLRVRICILIPGLSGGRFPNGVENLGFSAFAAKSAKVVGLPVPPSLYESIEILSGQIDKSWSGPRAAAAIGVAKTYAGFSRASVKPYVDEVMTKLPAWKPGEMHLGYIYLSTLLCFNQGGRSDAWRKWNQELKTTFLPNAKNGVWPCKDAWFGPIGSKVATNAIVSQIFECYYRYKEIDGSGMGTLEKEQDKWIPLAPQAAAEGRLYRFNANGLRTVRGDGEYHRIPVDSLDSEATPGYITTPVAYQGVFLQSELKNPFAEPLLEGVGRVFLDSEYIGETRVTGADVGKSLTIPLGEDPQVTVKRMILQNVFAGSKESKLRTLNVDIKIEVVNNRKTPAQIKIMDRLATTVDTRVRLRKPVLSGGTKQELHEDGIALWYGVVTPGGNLLVNGHYEVEYPVGVIPQAVSEDGYDDDEEYAEDDDGMDW